MRPIGCLIILVLAFLIAYVLSWITGISAVFFILLMLLILFLWQIKEALENPKRQELILSILIQEGRELYVSEIMELSEGQLKSSTEVHHPLRYLESRGYVTSRMESEPLPGRIHPRRLYRATGRRLDKRKLSFHLPAWARPLSNPHATKALRVLHLKRFFVFTKLSNQNTTKTNLGGALFLDY